jgi:hypothetical protein
MTQYIGCTLLSILSIPRGNTLPESKDTFTNPIEIVRWYIQQLILFCID